MNPSRREKKPLPFVLASVGRLLLVEPGETGQKATIIVIPRKVVFFLTKLRGNFE